MADPASAFVGVLEREHFRSERFRDKLTQALAVTANAIGQANRPYLAISGGKDSLCVLALALSVDPNIALHWTDDELEYPETVDYMTWLKSEAGDQLTITLGRSEHAGWFTPWTDRPYWRDPLPGSIRKKIPADDWMAARGHDLTLTGVRANESRRRRDHLRTVRALQGPAMIYPVASGTGRRCCPIHDWTEDDVLAMIAGWGLKYNAAYDRLATIGVVRERQRIGPLPLTPRAILAEGWPDLLTRLEARYGERWTSRVSPRVATGGRVDP